MSDVSGRPCGAAGTDPAAGALEAACAEVAADGTDPGILARVLGWSARPRRGPDALRRACRDGPASDLPPARRLADAVGDALSAADRRAAAQVVATWVGLGVRVAILGDPAYPSRLADGWPDTDGPTFVAWQGVAARDDAPAVAIVGARRASGYGTAVAAWLAEAAAQAGARVVSGGAVGIDAAAHAAACDEPGRTTVVLGCGHAIGYPRVHARTGGLFHRIIDRGGTILAELLPHEPPRAGQVRARNRIVAGLADVVVVVEGGARSGALLTAGAAAQLGRTVLAVPGDVRAPGSAAPHRLLAEGVAPCTGPEDLLAALPARVSGGGSDRVAPPGPEDRASSSDGSHTAAHRLTTLPAEVHEVLVEAWPRPVRVEALAIACARPVPALLAALTRARVAGELAEGADGIRLRRPP